MGFKQKTRKHPTISAILIENSIILVHPNVLTISIEPLHNVQLDAVLYIAERRNYKSSIISSNI